MRIWLGCRSSGKDEWTVKRSAIVQAHAAKAIIQNQWWTDVHAAIACVIVCYDPSTVSSTEGARRYIVAYADTINGSCRWVRVEVGAIIRAPHDILGGHQYLVNCDWGQASGRWGC